ncbi:tyrosine-type recombinase/integrase [Elizabethkingia anophelis]|uniref:site-specific tyrosine recombinase/integron integrase n=1 Tax=Elizabethkingia anophelis TaxID=1117645 RepID=UPI000BA87102|nr:site-specific tyrosine recombinase/integron integrase [Elizabethkingia anophelis]ASV78499.1 integrase [Elizabethkingia anophelis]MCL1647664.1 tyrosine-type recombinase/integrase [Elizabethkingia anophelis]MCL1683058.1 tyrosine-type recombinase/integrase [Elizabethkingia anophelis]MDV3870621.1 integrase [Elizabethkingia anophelis]MDV3962472.1 integrase [Elizabethkingia anophelis]
MKELVKQEIINAMQTVLNFQQLMMLEKVIHQSFHSVVVTSKTTTEDKLETDNINVLNLFISSKKVEGCSEKSLKYYFSTIDTLFQKLKKKVTEISTNDLRFYLSEYQEVKKSSKVTIDNIRRIFSSFFSWLEDEDYILKSPVRRIHKVKTARTIKEVLSDEDIEILRDNCKQIRDLTLIEMLSSTGIRVGELVKINIKDIDFHERSCIVTGKGNKQREVYFDARTKIHLKEYLETRNDDNEALFVSLSKPNQRLSIGGIESVLRKLGKKTKINKVHPHKFRRTLATMAIDKGMPIEQVQKLLGHVKIDTTLHYAMVNQANVKIAHRKFIS